MSIRVHLWLILGLVFGWPLFAEIFEGFFDLCGGNDRPLADAGAEPGGQLPVVAGLQVFLPEGIGPALLGFGRMNAAPVRGEKPAHLALLQLHLPHAMILLQEFLFEVGGLDLQKFRRFLDVLFIEIHYARFHTALETIGLALEPDGFLFPPFGHGYTSTRSSRWMTSS